MEIFTQQLINGITLGSIYGLIAIGYTMVFGIIGMVNFAHGDVFMVSAFIALITFLLLTTWLGISSVDVDPDASVTFLGTAAIAAVAGTLELVYYGVVSFADGFVPGVKGFTAAVLGGIGSLPCGVVGCLLIGLIETMWSAYFSTDY